MGVNQTLNTNIDVQRNSIFLSIAYYIIKRNVLTSLQIRVFTVRIFCAFITFIESKVAETTWTIFTLFTLHADLLGTTDLVCRTILVCIAPYASFVFIIAF